MTRTSSYARLVAAKRTMPVAIRHGRRSVMAGRGGPVEEMSEFGPMTSPEGTLLIVLAKVEALVQGGASYESLASCVLAHEHCVVVIVQSRDELARSLRIMAWLCGAADPHIIAELAKPPVASKMLGIVQCRDGTWRCGHLSSPFATTVPPGTGQRRDQLQRSGPTLATGRPRRLS
jgi:hypothetical protein